MSSLHSLCSKPRGGTAIDKAAGAGGTQRIENGNFS